MLVHSVSYLPLLQAAVEAYSWSAWGGAGGGAFTGIKLSCSFHLSLFLSYFISETENPKKRTLIYPASEPAYFVSALTS